MNTTTPPTPSESSPKPAAGAPPNCAVSTGSADSYFGAVSIVLTLHKRDGSLNVMNELSMVWAASRDEAIGYGVQEAQKRHPEHQVHSICATYGSLQNAAYEPTRQKTTDSK